MPRWWRSHAQGPALSAGTCWRHPGMGALDGAWCPEPGVPPVRIARALASPSPACRELTRPSRDTSDQQSRGAGYRPGRAAPKLQAGADRLLSVLLEHVARSPARERPHQPARVDRKSDPAGAPGEWWWSGIHPVLSGREIASCPFPARSRPPTLRTPSSPTLPPARSAPRDRDLPR